MAGEQTNTPPSGIDNPGGPPPSSGAGAIPPPSVGAPDLSPAQIAEARQTWIDAGYDVAMFDEAARKDGLDPNATPVSEVADLHAEFGLPISPEPADYTPRWADPVRITPSTHNELRQFAADLRLSPELGTALIEHLSELGLRWEGMDRTTRGLWLAEQRAISARQMGSDEAATTAQERAAAMLEKLGGAFGKFLAGHPVLVAPYLLTALSSHSQQLEQFAAAQSKRAK